MRRFLFLASTALFLFGMPLGGCSSESDAACEKSEDCKHGLACSEDGKCETIGCRSTGDCYQGDGFQEVCLFENNRGEYDLSADGVCTHEECRSDRDCTGDKICRAGACYTGAAGPIACDCREDCPGGQACLGGFCAAPVGACNNDCECAAGSSCDNGSCVEGGGSCVGDDCGGGTDSTLCQPCTDANQCGAEGNACVALPNDGGQVCAQACGDSAPCPSGFSCMPVDSRVGSQCIPTGLSCEGCLVTGCGAGQYCDGATGECQALAADCDACNSDSECGSGSACVAYGGTKMCLSICTPGAGDTCGAGFTCSPAAGKNVCAPSGGGCGNSSCDLLPSDCTGLTSTLDVNRCMCVGCVTADDCGSGQSCTAGGNCVSGTRPCSTTAECGGGYCQGGFCVDCLTPGDCRDGEICLSGACMDCGCGPNERCNASGDCVEIPDPRTCTNDAYCVNIARELGHSGTNAKCDSTVGCFIAGNCNGSAGGGDDPLGGMGDMFGEMAGEIDPFDAPCKAGTYCGMTMDFLGGIMGGSMFSFSCQGCVEGDANSCRQGESCSTPLFDLTGEAGPSCGAGGGGGIFDDFPFPFP